MEVVRFLQRIELQLCRSKDSSCNADQIQQDFVVLLYLKTRILEEILKPHEDNQFCDYESLRTKAVQRPCCLYIWKICHI